MIFKYVMQVGKRPENVGWYHTDPSPDFAAVKSHLAFYPIPMDEHTIDGERVTPQPGKFYCGWITSDVVVPFKGEHGAMGW